MKKKLQEIILKQFNESKIEPLQFLKLSEYVDNITDKKASEILQEFEPILTVAALGLVLGVIDGLIIRKIADDINKGKAYCKKMVSNIEDKNIAKVKMKECQIKVIDQAITKLKMSKKTQCNKLKGTDRAKCYLKVEKAIAYFENLKKKV